MKLLHYSRVYTEYIYVCICKYVILGLYEDVQTFACKHGLLAALLYHSESLGGMSTSQVMGIPFNAGQVSHFQGHRMSFCSSISM